MAKLNVQQARDSLNDFEFASLFIEELGWSKPVNLKPIAFQVKDSEFERRQIAQLGGVVVFEITSPVGKIPDAKTLAAVHKEVSKLHHENLLIFVDTQRTQSLWYWVKREDGKLRPREHLYVKGQPGDLFLSKLSSMVFDISEFDEAGNVSVVNVAKRLKDALDVQRVTKKFFREYDDERLAFLDLIKGVADERQRRWYASVLLNRLMFIYFLQRKGFIDDGEHTYLQAKLDECKGRFGKDQYYEKFLKPLFFEGFAKPEEDRSPEAKKLLGKIKYLNGGLFLPHRIELDNPDIRIADKAFENLLKLFQAYSWNLNDTPAGEDNEINPDVLGYIFEKYINQKAFGAYYTRPEITEYLCEQTIYKLVLEKINSPGIEGVMQPRSFDSMSELLLNLDAPLCRELLNDILPDLSLLDPACGSGAFLVAAMKTLVNIYAAVIGKIQFLNDRNLSKWLRRAQKEHPSVAYFIKKRIITDNLYGVDLMDEATEIARLRLFLALVASAETVDQLEPLPNIDFNILKGNSLIGLMHVEDNDFDERQAQGNLFRKSYRELLAEKNRLIDVYRHTGKYTDDLRSLRDNIEKKKHEAMATLDEILLTEFQELGIKFEQATWDDENNKEGKTKKRALTIKDIETLEPFHWGYEFDEIINNRGGFDAIIANPPWEVFETSEQEFLRTYLPAYSREGFARREWHERFSAEMSKSPGLRSGWCEYASRFPHSSAYFKDAPSYVAQRVTDEEGRRLPSKLNLYRLFLERCLRLLRQNGEAGLVVPTTLWTGRGAQTLRRTLFDNTTITGSFGFRNTHSIFENVGPQEEFLVLSFRKSPKGTSSFPATFMREHIEELADFPDQIGFVINLEVISSLYPRSLRVPEISSDTDVRILRTISKSFGLDDGSTTSWRIPLYQEFNMTGARPLFKQHAGANTAPLIQGASFGQFNLKKDSVSIWLDKRKARLYLLGSRTDKSERLPYQDYRVVHQRIARKNQSRSLVATVVPPDYFCADTAHTPRRTVPRELTLYMAAMFNSYVCDYQIRLVITSHLDKHFMDELRIPNAMEGLLGREVIERTAKLICTTPEFDDLATEIGFRDHSEGVIDPTERARIRTELDGMIAHLYGLTEEEFVHILSTFPLVEQSVRDAALDAYREFAPKPGDQEMAALIAKGESNTLEFKSSARWDFKQNKQNKAMEDVVVKTVAALLNTDGGNLLIGVDDDRNVLGLEYDYKLFGKSDKRDAYENFLTTLLLSNLGKDTAALISIGIHQLNGNDVARVAVTPSPKPIFVRDDKYEHLYIRAGNSTRLLSTREAIDYCNMHWRK